MPCTHHACPCHALFSRSVPATWELYVEMRFTQLRTACDLELWAEAFRRCGAGAGVEAAAGLVLGCMTSNHCGLPVNAMRMCRPCCVSCS